jgi:hypothetical protein
MNTETIPTLPAAPDTADEAVSDTDDGGLVPIQLSLLGTSPLAPSLHLDLETRRRGLRHIAEIRAMLNERRRQRLDDRDAA